MVVETRHPQVRSRVLGKSVEPIRGGMWVSVSHWRRVSLSDCRFLSLRNLCVSQGRPNVVDTVLLIRVQLLWVVGGGHTVRGREEKTWAMKRAVIAVGSVLYLVEVSALVL